MASTVIQVYLKQILESFFHKSNQVRLAALGVTTLILKQGLVHPVQVIYVHILEVCSIPNVPPASLKMNVWHSDKKSLISFQYGNKNGMFGSKDLCPLENDSVSSTWMIVTYGDLIVSLFTICSHFKSLIYNLPPLSHKA